DERFVLAQGLNVRPVLAIGIGDLEAIGIGDVEATDSEPGESDEMDSPNPSLADDGDPLALQDRLFLHADQAPMPGECLLVGPARGGRLRWERCTRHLSSLRGSG